jgi:hypothetical protein
MEISLGHLYAPLATVVALSMATWLSMLLFGRTPKRLYKEMPGQRSHASRLIGRQLFGNERLMLGKTNIGKKPGKQADRA